MKKLLILLSLTLTVSLAETATKKRDVKVIIPQNSSNIVTREVRTFRIARSGREVRSERTSRFSRLVRVLRTSRVSRITHHIVKTPTPHIASVK